MTTKGKLTLPSQEVLVQILEYKPATGDLIWKHRSASFFTSQKAADSWNRRYSGKPAMTSIAANGYAYGSVMGVSYKAHRIIWVLVYGEEPFEVDHINGVRNDNRLENLRNVSRSENSRNMKIRSDNTSGHFGVYYMKHRGTWFANYKVDGVITHLGSYNSKDEAIAARQRAEASQGFHENHGRSDCAQ